MSVLNVRCRGFPAPSFEGIDSERGLATPAGWKADRVRTARTAPCYGFIEAGLVKGDASGSMPRPWRPTPSALTTSAGRLAQESPGIETRRGFLVRKRKGKKLGTGSSPKDGLWPWIWTPSADYGRRDRRVAAAKENLDGGHAAKTGRMCDRKGFLVLATRPMKTRISEPKQKGFGAGTATGRPAGQSPTTGPGCYSGVAKEAFKLRAEIVERSFAHPRSRRHAPDMLRGRENVHKRYAPCRRPQSEAPAPRASRRCICGLLLDLIVSEDNRLRRGAPSSDGK